MHKVHCWFWIFDPTTPLIDSLTSWNNELLQDKGIMLVEVMSHDLVEKIDEGDGDVQPIFFQVDYPPVR